MYHFVNKIGICGYMIYKKINRIKLNTSIRYGLETTREITTICFKEKYSKERTSMGFYIRPNLLITNYHVIEPLLKNNKLIIKIKGNNQRLFFIFDDAPIAINLSDTRSPKNKDLMFIKIFYDKDNDLACLQLKNQNNNFIDPNSKSIFIDILKYIFGNDIYKPSVFSIGPCINNVKQMSYGVVLDSKIINNNNTNISTIRSNIYTPPGFSGGPLLTYHGYLIGINFCAANPNFTTSFAIDTNTILKILQHHLP